MAGLFKKILNRFSREKVDWDELEESLVAGDLGVKMSMQIVDRLQDMGRKLKAEDVIEVCREEIRAILPADQPPLDPLGDRPKVILVVGVNGTGKTTSTAKLAHLFQRANFTADEAVRRLRIGVEDIGDLHGHTLARICTA